MTSILVVGAGIAGLSAGYRLSQAGFDVRVVEAAAAPGGRMADLRDGDIAYNSGARLIYPFGQALWDLIRELGLEAVPIRNLSAACRIDGTPYRLDLMPTARTLRTPGLTWNDRLRLVRFGSALFGCDPGLTRTIWPRARSSTGKPWPPSWIACSGSGCARG